ncbi:response regulator transcription factor [Bacillus sp. FJAT-27445]|uniref:response regulator transcription factor n=1 Tax=Bacillus sp. FJAT-27445 TaxID=1679166 RepID=UPI000743F6FE|nr:response regulator transcription factor [Bacillus sp. FJAT-27445]
MKTILLVDDEKRMLDLLDLYITPNGYFCVKKQSGAEALDYLENKKVNLVILDVMMPDMDGLATCKKIRETYDVPIIMLTARDSTEDVVKGLKIGADDYLTKPFNEKELLARMEAVMRRTKDTSQDFLTFNGLKLDQESYSTSFKNELISLTPKEFTLLGLLVGHPNKVFTRDHLLSTVWGYNSNVDDRTIDSHIRNVRDKLRKVGFPVDVHLKTVWGVGYKWSTEGE